MKKEGAGTILHLRVFIIQASWSAGEEEEEEANPVKT